MARELDTATLDQAAQDYARNWVLPDIKARSGKTHTAGPSWVMECLYNAHFKDEHEYIVEGIKGWLSPNDLPTFEARAKEIFKPRNDKTFADMLRDQLAIDPDGNHLPGYIGKVEIGTRFIEMIPVQVRRRDWLVHRRWCLANGKDPGPPQLETKIVPYRWPVYAGEPEEREGNTGVADELPQGADPFPLGVMHALAPNISAEAAIGAVDFIVDSLDEGSTAATIRCRTGSQPADPDAAETGTLLATLTCSDPAFNAAVDDTDGTVSATAAAITDDSSADATGTCSYCRAGATGTGADDHIDGSAGTTASENFNFNTVSFVAGSTVSITSFVVGLDQGSSAT